jgi:hypothetical protein
LAVRAPSTLTAQRGWLTPVRPAWQRHAFLFAAALAAIALAGYHVGTFDQAVHLPFLEKFANPALFPNDAFLELRNQHTSFFWFAFVPFYHWGMLEPALFVTHWLATYLTLETLWALSLAIYANRLGALLVVLAAVFPHIGFRSSPLLEFSLLNRTFVFPFILLALTLYLRERTLAAYGLLGLAYNLHAISVNFALAMLVFDSLLRLRRVGWRTLAGGGLLFIAAALPVLAWRWRAAPPALGVDAEWFSVLVRAMFLHMFSLAAWYPPIVAGTLSGLSALALFLIALRAQALSAQVKVIGNFVAAGLLILAAGVITANWFPVTLIIELQIFRVGHLLLVFAYLSFANFLAEQFETGRLSRRDFAVSAATVVIATIPAVPLIIYAIQRGITSPRWRQGLAAGSLAVLVTASFAVFIHYQAWYPGIYIWPRPTPWYQAQLWARDATPPGTVFITPPQIWGLYVPEWRVFSERSTVVSLSELLETAFAPGYLPIWKPRFEALAPGALDRFNGDFFQSQATTAAAFYSLSAGRLLSIARQYGATYVVVERPHTFAWPVAYSNAGFTIYDLRDLAAP